MEPFASAAGARLPALPATHIPVRSGRPSAARGVAAGRESARLAGPRGRRAARRTSAAHPLRTDGGQCGFFMVELSSLPFSFRRLDITNPHDNLAAVSKRDLAEKRQLGFVARAVRENGHRLPLAEHVTAQATFSQRRGWQRLQRPLLRLLRRCP